MIALLACAAPKSPGDPRPEPAHSALPAAPHSGPPTGDSGEPAGSGHTARADATTVFVAQGDRGRLAISCDGGLTWPVDGSDDDAFRCFVDGDCDHDPGAGRGVAFGDGAFVATFGWGFPGSVRRLAEGEAAFSTVLSGHTFAGVAFDAGVFLASERPPFRSTDGGQSWAAAGEVTSAQWNVRRTGGGEGLFLVAFDSGATDLAVSDDGGLTFRSPSAWPPECGRSIQWEGGLGVAGGVALVLGGDGVACRSTDGGDTWTSAPIGGSVTGRLVVGPAGFETWGDAGGVSTRFTSADGASWTAEPTTLAGAQPGPWIGAVALAPDGTRAAVNAGWDQWYERQRFYRSTDGLRWEELPAGAYTGSHPLRFLAAGESSEPPCP